VLWPKHYFMIDIHMYDYLYYESTSYNLITHMFYKLNFEALIICFIHSTFNFGITLKSKV